jgi:hypothetical protein
MATTNFYLDKADKQGKSFILMTYLCGGQKFRHSVKIKGPPSKWIARKQRLKGIKERELLKEVLGAYPEILWPGLELQVTGEELLTTAPVSNLVFHYVYDTRGRLIEKTVPSKGTMYVVYDPLNRPVLMQDANMLAKNQWNYIKYDAKGRAISQGIYTDITTTPTSHIGRVNMQAYVNTLSYATWYESRTTTLTNNGYYTSAVFPVSGTGMTLSPLAYSYYDDYDMNFDGTADFSYVTQSDPSLPNEETATAAQLKGMPTIVCKTRWVQD